MKHRHADLALCDENEADVLTIFYGIEIIGNIDFVCATARQDNLADFLTAHGVLDIFFINA